MHFHTNGLALRLVLLEAKVNYSSMSCSESLLYNKNWDSLSPGFLLQKQEMSLVTKRSIC